MTVPGNTVLPPLFDSYITSAVECFQGHSRFVSPSDAHHHAYVRAGGRSVVVVLMSVSRAAHRNPKIPKTAMLLFVQIVHSYGTHNAIVVLVPASIETQPPEFANAGLLTPF
jgi:hypothetical protein